MVDQEKCLGCGACAGACPVGAITIEDKAKIDNEICVKCGTCAGICPVEAITID